MTHRKTTETTERTERAQRGAARSRAQTKENMSDRFSTFSRWLATSAIRTRVPKGSPRQSRSPRSLTRTTRCDRFDHSCARLVGIATVIQCPRDEFRVCVCVSLSPLCSQWMLLCALCGFSCGLPEDLLPASCALSVPFHALAFGRPPTSTGLDSPRSRALRKADMKRFETITSYWPWRGANHGGPKSV